MKNKAILIILLSIFCLSSFVAYAKEDKKYVRQGNKLYESKKYNDAEIKYRKALSKNPNNEHAEFNLGDALYKQGNYEDAANKFELMNNKKLSKDDKNNIKYNLGNSYFEQSRQKAKSGDQQASMDLLKKSIDSYKGALKLNGKDENARYNYELAKRLLIQQQNQQNQQNKDNKNNKDDKNKDKQNQNKDQQNKDNKNNKDNQNKDNKNNKDQNKNDKNKDNNNKDKNKDNKQNKSDNNDKNEQNKNQDQQQNPQPQNSKISNKDAERILNALQIQEKDKMNKLKKMKAGKSKIDKKW